MIAFGPVVVLLLCLLVVWMGVRSIVRACRVPKGVEWGGSCGGCGYPYSGWPRCPECGGEIGTVGIATPRMILKHRGSLGGAVFALTLMAAALGFLLTGLTLAVCQAAGSMQWIRQGEYGEGPERDTSFGVLVHWDVLGPPSAGRGRGEIAVVLDLTARYRGVSTRRPQTDRGPHVLIDVASGAYVQRDELGRVVSRGASFGPEEAQQLLELAGMPMTQAERKAAGAQLASLADAATALDAAAFRPAPAYTGAEVLFEGATTTVSVPSLPFAVFGRTSTGGAMIISAAIASAVYVLTLVWMVRRRRRVMRDLASDGSGGRAAHDGG